MSPRYLPPRFSSIWLSVWKEMSFKEFQDGRASLISERNEFSHSKSTCCPNASYQVSVQSDLQFWRRCRKCEKLITDDGRRTDRRRTDDGRRTAGHGISLSEASNSPWTNNTLFESDYCNLKVFDINAVCSFDDSISIQHKYSLGQY